MQQHTAQFQRKRKFLLALPIIGVPLMTLLLWSMGMGRSTGEATADTSRGINMRLPSPDMKGIDHSDKLTLYQQAEKDSMARARMIGTDTLIDRSISGDLSLPIYEGDRQRQRRFGRNSDEFSASGTVRQDQDPNEALVRARLQALDRELNKATTAPVQTTPLPGTATDTDQTLAQLEKMLRESSPMAETDPQMEQVKEVLERIMDVQHPELVKERIQAASEKNKERVYLVSTQANADVVDLITPRPVALPGRPVPGSDTSRAAGSDSLTAQPERPSVQLPPASRFFELDGQTTAMPAGNAATAVVHGTQVMLPGGTLTMRLTQDIYLQGVLIPAGTQVHGECQLSGERLNVSITAITYGDSRYPVALKVYDYDGLAGIRIRDAISRQTTARGADQALQGMQLYSMDPSLGAQAAAAGVETVKTLLSKKIRLVKTTVKADYPVLLVDNNASRQ